MNDAQHPTHIEEYNISGGRFLIEASAGTGKTYTIANLVRRLVTERRIPMSKFLVTTFSKAAAAELKIRITKELNEALDKAVNEDDKLLLRLAVTTIDEATITTINGFCQKMLGDYVLESGVEFDTAFQSDASKIKEDILCKFIRKKYYQDAEQHLQQNKTLYEQLSNLAYAYTNPSKKLRKSVAPECTELYSMLCRECDTEKDRMGILTFDDQISRLHKALSDPDLCEYLIYAINARYQAVFVDEFQDTDQKQFGIFDRCFPITSPVLFYMIGDPKQSIYRFRGADVHAYLHAKELQKGSNIYTLTRNYRSAPAMIESVNRIFGGNKISEADETEDAFLQENIPFVAVNHGEKNANYVLCENGKAISAALRIRHYLGKQENKTVFTDIANEIVSLLSAKRNVTIGETLEKQRPLRASDIAILVLKNKDAGTLVQMLNEHGISASACKSGKIFTSEEALWYRQLLETLLEPSEANIRNLMLSPFFRIPCELLANNDYDYSLWYEIFLNLKEIWEQHGLPAAFESFLHTGFPAMKDIPLKKILTGPGGERTMTNFQHLTEMLYEKATEEELSPALLKHWLVQKIAGTGDDENAESKSGDDNPDQLRLDKDSAAVQIVTFFVSKGLEYPIVFLPYPVSKTDIDMRPITSKTFEIRDKNENWLCINSNNKDPDVISAEKETIREQLRLFYVAMTRAKFMTYLYIQTLDPEADNSHKRKLLRSAVGKILSAPGQEAAIDEQLDYLLATKAAFPEHPAEWFRCLCMEKSTREWNHIEVYEDDPDPGNLREEEDASCELSARNKPQIPHHWHLQSYTGYHYRKHDGIPAESSTDRDDPDQPETDEQVLPENEKLFLSFPRGCRIGTFIHIQLEDLISGTFEGTDYSGFAPENGLTESAIHEQLVRRLQASHFDSNYAVPLFDGLSRALRTKLPETDCSVSQLRKCLPEQEFYLAAPGSLNLPEIIKILHEEASPGVRSCFKPLPASEEKLNGVLNGVTDLLFECNGKYYFADWKTNYLGDHFSDYRSDKLMNVMDQNGYLLQHYLYSAAVYRMLKQRMKSFDYSVFGGAFYLFIRGMDENGNGIWFDRPTQRCLERLLTLFQGDQTK